MGKGVLLELDGRKAIVMTPQGEFKRVLVPRDSMEVGDEIDFAETRPAPWARWGLAAAAAVVMLATGTFGYNTWTLAQPMAMVTIDINPSMRLTVNKNDQVLTAEGLNQDGVQVLQGVEWKRRLVDEVVADITAEAIEVNKLNIAEDSSAVVVSVSPISASKELPAAKSEEIAVKAKNAISAEVSQQGKTRGVSPKTTVPVLQATAEEKAEAEAKGLTPGQFLILKEIQVKMPAIQAEQIKQMGPGKLLKSLEMNPGDVFGKAEEHHGGKNRRGDKNGSNGGQQQPVLPATGKPNENPKADENPGKSKSDQDDKKAARPDEKGKADDKPKPGDDRSDSGKGKSDEKRSDDRDKKDDKGSEDKKKSGSSNDNWRVPLFNVDIPKPGFLRADDDKLSDQPRAETPGAGATAEKETGKAVATEQETDKGKAPVTEKETVTGKDQASGREQEKGSKGDSGKEKDGDSSKGGGGKGK